MSFKSFAPLKSVSHRVQAEGWTGVSTVAFSCKACKLRSDCGEWQALHLMWQQITVGRMWSTGQANSSFTTPHDRRSDLSDISGMLDQKFILPYAHRGLHDTAQGVIENTTTAFEKAIAHKVGIECDLRPASDATPMVYHDLTLERLMEAEGRIDLLSPAMLARLDYRGSGDRMLTLDELLELTAGRVPLLIEIKNDFVPTNLSFLAKIAASASSYKGPAALMSFDPAVIAYMQQQARGVPRGLVAGRYRDTGWWSDRLEPARRAALSALADADRLDAAFVNYRVGDLPTPETQAMRMRQVRHVFAWTVRTANDRTRARKYADAAVFEGTIPW